MRGIISDIQKFSLHDGPGIRTTIFLKGCTLHCQWCHNPESIALKPELMRATNKCIGCGACLKACSFGALTKGDDGIIYNRDLCQRCFKCVKACPSGALTIAGTEMEAQEVVDCAMADIDYYRASGGGITLSGGDPVFQSDFSCELLQLFQKAGVHTAMESALNAPWETVEKLAKHLDLLFFDMKLIDAEQHMRYTGVSNEQILDNVKRLSAAGISMAAHVPLIPGITDTDENISGIAEWLAKHAPGTSMQLLNYNPIAQAKWENIGLCYPLGKLGRLSAKRLDALCGIARGKGVDCFWEQE